jgi:hypothetical protein
MNANPLRQRVSTVLVLALTIGLAILIVASLGRANASTEVAAALLGALMAGLLSVVLRYIDFVERDQERREQSVLNSLHEFGGGTQHRNVGIAVVMGYWNSVPKLRPLLVPLLGNQAIYLLKEAKRKDAAHEVSNLGRIAAVLAVAAGREWSASTTFKELLDALDWAIDQNSRAAQDRDPNGLDIEPALIRDWKSHIQAGLKLSGSRQLVL